ncbi:translation initiation factor IF-2 isoform X2 [Bombyx mori]|uniref:translation initiation factor IF-2 isoform X2 n=1 Tax=Bombyx mori TaxID=7091 RepID=UPI002ED6B1EF
MDGGDRILVAAGLTAAVVVGAFVLWGPGGAPKVRKRRGQIAGLQNMGRTCFLNTLLQALAACPTFIEWLKRYAKANSHNSMITTLYTVIEVVNGTHESARGTPVCPLGVLQSLRAAGWVVPADQQDAHELLHVLLTCIEEETAAMARKPGCLSDALGLGGGRAWSALASPASPPAAPATPSLLTRPASAAPGDEPDLADPEPNPGPLVRKGVSRSFCQLSSVGRRWACPAPARPAPSPPFRGTLASRLHCTVCSTKFLLDVLAESDPLRQIRQRLVVPGQRRRRVQRDLQSGRFTPGVHSPGDGERRGMREVLGLLPRRPRPHPRTHQAHPDGQLRQVAPLPVHASVPRAVGWRTAQQARRTRRLPRDALHGALRHPASAQERAHVPGGRRAPPQRPQRVERARGRGGRARGGRRPLHAGGRGGARGGRALRTLRHLQEGERV